MSSRPSHKPPRVTKPGRGSSRAPLVKKTPVSSRTTSAIKLESLKRGAQESPDLRGTHKAVLPKIRSTVDRFDDLIEGRIDDLPPKPPSEVRLFLSSTFTDMRTERNWLAREAYPRIKDYCYHELGVDFSVVDMRWGVTDDATNEHVTEELCLSEIRNCQRVGLGPTFVTILGDRYGYRPIPTYIEEGEFDVLLQEAVVFDRHKVELLKSWYVRDDNAVPPIYVLQPISTRIPGFGDHSNETLARQAREKWWGVLESLQGVLRTAVDAAHHNGRLSGARRHDYYNSVTECEIAEGLVKAGQPNASCLSFVRRFAGLDAHALKANPASAERFIEARTQHGLRTIDQEVERLRTQLTQQCIPAHLGAERIHHYTLPWQPEGVRPEKYDAHADYMRNFCGDFINGVLTQIGLAKHKLDTQIPVREYYTYYDEMLHHLHFCKEKVEQFRGQEEILMQAKEYLSNPKNRAPLVLHAESGGGKTSIMAKMFMLLPTWFGQDIFRCIRFLGTSPQTTNIYDVLRYVAGQLADNYDKIMEPVGYKTMRALLKYFPRYIRNISRITKQRIFILLDSIDQLSPLYDAFNMKWLMTELPSNVHIVISTLPQLHGILDNTRALGLKESSFIQVKPLQESTGREIIEAHLVRHKRTLTPQQMALVQHAVKSVPNPLYLKLLMDRAVLWRSYTETSDVTAPDSVRAAIAQLFSRLEGKFGAVLVAHTLGYVTVGMNGLSEVELEDVLSCDDAVLDEVYHYHSPPVEGLIRLPPVLWARLRHELREYLSERRSQAKTTLSWYHRQFTEAARDRYVQAGQARVLHQGLANYYQAEEGVQKDITLSKRKLTIPDADRQVTANPLTPNNIRLLMTLPYHLRHTGDVIQLKMVTLCNLRFLMTKIKALGVSGVLKDFEEVSAAGLMDADLRIVYKTLEEIKSTLGNSQHLPAEILARVPEDKMRFPCASQLVSDCRNFIINLDQNSVMPVFPCLYETAATVESLANVAAILAAQGNLVFCQVGDASPSLIVMDYSELSPQSVCTMKTSSAILPQLSADCRLLYYFQPIIATRSRDKEVTYVSLDTKLCAHVLSDKERGEEKQSELNVLIEQTVPPPGDPTEENEYAVACYDVSQDNSLLLCCYGNQYVVVYNLDEGSVSVTYSVTRKTSQATSSNELIMVQGTEQEFITCSFGNTYKEAVVLIESVEDDKHWTTLDVRHIVTSQCNTIQIPGRVLKDKWRLTRDEKFFIAPVEDTSGVTRIVTCQLEAGRSQSLKVTEKVLDFDACRAQQLLGFVLHQTAIDVYDLQALTLISTLTLGDDSPTCISVEGDAQYLYCGLTSGALRVWQVDDSKDVGRFDFHSGAIRRVVLTYQDESVLVHCGDESVRAVSQAALVDACQSQQLSHGQLSDHSLSSLSHIDNTAVLFVHSSNSNNELLTCTTSGHVITWNLDTCEIENRVSLSDKDSFSPHAVLYSSTNHAIFHDQHDAVVLDLVDQSVVKTISLDEKRFLSMTTDGIGVAYGLVVSNGKLSVLVIDMATGEMTSSMEVKDTVNSEKIDLMLTHDRHYLVLKVLCSKKELEIIRKAEHALHHSKAKVPLSLSGDYKLLVLPLRKPTGKLIPCLRHLTGVPCLMESTVPLTGSTMLIGRGRKAFLWEIENGDVRLRMVQGTKIQAFFRPQWIETWERDWGKLCYGKMPAMAFRPTPEGGVAALGSEDGWLTLFDEEGRCIQGTLGKTPNHTSSVERVEISPSGAWVASVTSGHVLKCWSVRDRGQQVFSIKLNVKVVQLEFSADDTVLAVLGMRSDGSTKVLLFRVLAKYD